MTKHQRYPSFTDANVPVPECITTLLRDGISELPDNGFKTRYLKQEIMSKFVSDDTDPPALRRQRAIEKWLAIEAKNADTNAKLLFMDEEYNILPRLSWATFRAKARSVIDSIIGAAPTEETLIGSFSGGASTSRSRTCSFPAAKYLGKADVTADALGLFLTVVKGLPGWLQFADDIDFNIVGGNELFTVPKKTDIDRVACKEPDFNMFLQKGVGNHIRECLRRNGIDLNDQSRNRELARLGSEFNSLATLDLSSASDSVTVQLCAELLSPAWFHLLMQLRSPVTFIDGEQHVNEMISSMGNGFTFELESLLFYALARTTAYFEGIRGVISVYGDDIIVPTALAEQLIWVLSVMGFSINVEKSFADGPFRESCGGHYYNGSDVTPFYLRKPVKTLVDLIHVANSLRRWAGRGAHSILDLEVYPLWEMLRDEVPKSLWGGRDLELTTQLVTPHHPRKRLVQVSEKRRLSPRQRKGALVHWLNTTWARENGIGEGVITSSVSMTIDLFRSRPADKTAVSPLRQEFLQEL